MSHLGHSTGTVTVFGLICVPPLILSRVTVAGQTQDLLDNLPHKAQHNNGLRVVVTFLAQLSQHSSIGRQESLALPKDDSALGGSHLVEEGGRLS